MQLKNVIAISAIAGLASAANSTLTTATPDVTSHCSFSDFTATASNQVQSVAACETAVGDITIQGTAFGTVELTGLQQLYGSLHVLNATQATTVNAPTLQLVSGELEFNANTILSNLNLAQLTTVGSLTLNALPALDNTGLTAGLTSADSVVISDTGLSSLTGINVYQLKVFNVNNNDNIDTIDSGLREVTDTIDISYNAEKVDVILNQLTGAKNIVLQSINSFSAPNLTLANGSIAISSSSIEKVEFAELTSIGNSLTINKNEDLTELDFPQLKSIGGALQVSDNDELKSFAGFPKLQTIGGSVNINGTFDNGTFESLSRVAGGFILKTDGDLSCSAFNKLNTNGDIKGDKFQCEDKQTTSSSSSRKSNSDSTDSSDSTETGSNSGSSSTSSGSSSSTSSRRNGAASNTGKLASVVAGFAAVGVALF
ncbi:GPI-anchored extracellular protein, putative [Candida maltosa Xu316]|uniref:GPI-anchored extracellular protein, putative n=1 Tax=Candida maltosa (strain Xu316) TaxID=1245528 RepID=M3JWU3_CANMX|nr:GPI-anchored extracellular protein, putative [Candida maltosa Xu316]